MNAPYVPPEATTELFAGDNPASLKGDVSIVQATKAYRSHDLSQVSPPHRISFEDQPAEKHPTEPPHQTERHPEPESRQLNLGVNKPLRSAFFVSLGWGAGRVSDPHSDFVVCVRCDRPLALALRRWV